MRLFKVLALFPLASASLLQAQDDPVQQVQAAEQAVIRAMHAKDTAALEKLWSPEMKVNSPANTILDRAAVFALLKGGKIEYSEYSNTVESTATFQNDLAIVMGHETLKQAVGPDVGKSKVRRYTDVWQRTKDGSWMQIARQATYIATP